MCLNEIYSKLHTGNSLPGMFPVQNSLKQGDTLSPLVCNFALKYAITMFQEDQMGLQMEGTHTDMLMMQICLEIT
jgi:hypothetical protein